MKEKKNNLPDDEIVDNCDNIDQEQPENAEEVVADVDPLQKELDEIKELHLRTLAEYDNFRKRSQKEKESIYSNTAIDILNKVLPVIDNFERALDAQTSDESYKKGFEMIFNQFKNILESLGVKEIPAQGQIFDPEYHNAIILIEDENLDSNTVAEVVQKGYMLNDKVLRHAMVKVVQ